MFVRTFNPQNTHNTHAAIQFQLDAGLTGSEAMAAGTMDIAVGIQILITPTNGFTQAPIVVTISVTGGSAGRKLVDITITVHQRFIFKNLFHKPLNSYAWQCLLSCCIDLVLIMFCIVTS